MVHNNARLNIKSSSLQGNRDDSTELCLFQIRIAEQTKSLPSPSCFLPGIVDATVAPCYAQNTVREQEAQSCSLNTVSFLGSNTDDSTGLYNAS